MEVIIAQISSLRNKLGFVVDTSKTKPTRSLRKPRLIQKISLGFLLFVASFIFFYGYCWGWWGRNSLLMQYIFQCGCPVSSHEMRYPERVDVVIPACDHNGVILSPSGRLLYVNKYTLWDDLSYFWNLQTDEKISYTFPSGSKYFLTDDLIFYENKEYILDRTNETQYPIQRFLAWSPDSYVNGEINLSLLAKALRNAKNVYLIDNDIVVALTPNFLTGWFDIPGNESHRVEQFLQENEITYQYISGGYSSEAISPNGKFIAKLDGIYLTETNQKVAEGFSATGEYRPTSGKYFRVTGWFYDGNSVIYSKVGDVCLIEMSIFVGQVCIIKVPQPVLKLKVPQEFLLPVQ